MGNELQLQIPFVQHILELCSPAADQEIINLEQYGYPALHHKIPLQCMEVIQRLRFKRCLLKNWLLDRNIDFEIDSDLLYQTFIAPNNYSDLTDETV